MCTAAVVGINTGMEIIRERETQFMPQLVAKQHAQCGAVIKNEMAAQAALHKIGIRDVTGPDA